LTRDWFGLGGKKSCATRANSLRTAMAELIETKTRNLEDEILYQVYSDYSLEESSGNHVDRDDLENILRLSTRTKNFSIRKACHP
jgi:hypothetical protein